MFFKNRPILGPQQFRHAAKSANAKPLPLLLQRWTKWSWMDCRVVRVWRRNSGKQVARRTPKK
jgi:hypothetical protein